MKTILHWLPFQPSTCGFVFLISSFLSFLLNSFNQLSSSSCLPSYKKHPIGFSASLQPSLIKVSKLTSASARTESMSPDSRLSLPHHILRKFNPRKHKHDRIPYWCPTDLLGLLILCQKRLPSVTSSCHWQQCTANGVVSLWTPRISHPCIAAFGCRAPSSFSVLPSAGASSRMALLSLGPCRWREQDTSLWGWTCHTVWMIIQ